MLRLFQLLISTMFTDTLSLQKTDIDVVDGSDDIIQTLSSVETPASSPDKKGRVKASVWVKSLDLKTPTKQSPTITITDDSAKKKKKYTR